MPDWSKIGKCARRKGGEYERKICHTLSDLSGIKFKRSPRSGALLREGKINGAYISGDLISELEFKFSIECKNRKNIDLNSVLKSPQTSELIKSWHQCVYDAQISDKLPLLFFYIQSCRHDYIGFDETGKDLFNSCTPTIHINHFNGPVTYEIDQKDITLTLPPIYISSIKTLENINWNNLFIR